MKPEGRSRNLLAQTRSKAKMVEYNIPEKEHLTLKGSPEQLLVLTIGILGDLAASIGRDNENFDSDGNRYNLLFAARYFDAYLQSKLNAELDSYLMLIGAATYYLCGLPGSAQVLARKIPSPCPNMDAAGLEIMLHSVLLDQLTEAKLPQDGPYSVVGLELLRTLSAMFGGEQVEERLFALCKELRQLAYSIGSPRELLFADTVVALVKTKYKNSAWYALPKYSALNRDAWSVALVKEDFIHELWPAQHLTGEQGLLLGRSGVVQMPTSAGKTKSTELIIRSAFLSGRTQLCIVVAPFRALCHEIRNSLVQSFKGERVNVDELTDATQQDFEVQDLLGNPQVVVVTPEKLVYVLRHEPELARQAGLVIFDEGHQFDSGARGITYELLVTALRELLMDSCQKVLISAVVTNAPAIGTWLDGDDTAVVTGSNLIPTFRSIGFASWPAGKRGQIHFVSESDPDVTDYYVPRVIQEWRLTRKKGERKDRFFPERGEPNTIALFLGLKSVPNGSVAIFCGRKDTASGMCESVLDAYARDLNLPPPERFSDSEEVKRLVALYAANLGTKANATECAQLGIFSHHGNTPHGIRLCVEHAMRTNKAKLVICTSTLAQGVNLPIRYLIVASTRQGKEQIKTRDFHNLMGRAGRAGMHTEGSVIFADPSLYDRSFVDRDRRWNEVKSLLDPSKSEPCASDLLSIFEPIRGREGSYIVMEPLDFCDWYISGRQDLSTLAQRITQQHGAKLYPLSEVEEQIARKLGLIKAIESYLMWDAEFIGREDGLVEVENLAKQTLAYFLAKDEPDKQKLIVSLFRMLAENIAKSVLTAEKSKLYSQTLYGLKDAQEIEAWSEANRSVMSEAGTRSDLLRSCWSLMSAHIQNKNFQKCDNASALLALALNWIEGRPFDQLFSSFIGSGARLIWGERRRDYKIEDVVDICESGFGYDGALLLGAISEFVGQDKGDESQALVTNLDALHKCVKYGLPTPGAAAVFETGFADRVIAQELTEAINGFELSKRDVKRTLRNNQDAAKAILEAYPSYFLERLTELQ